jgi:outer membrane protein assembly factor BamB
MTGTKLYQVRLRDGVVENVVEGYGSFETVTGPVIANGLLYWGTGADGNGTLETISVPDLEAGPDPLFTGGPVRTPPLVQDGVVYFGSEDGNVYAVREGTGEWLWIEELSGPVTAGFAIANGKLYATDDTQIYAIVLPEVPSS